MWNIVINHSNTDLEGQDYVERLETFFIRQDICFNIGF